MLTLQIVVTVLTIIVVLMGIAIYDLMDNTAKVLEEITVQKLINDNLKRTIAKYAIAKYEEKRGTL